MKHKNLLLIPFLLTSFIFSCSKKEEENTTPPIDNTNPIDIDPIEEIDELEQNKIGKTLEGSFAIDSKSITSTKENSLGVLKEVLSKGTFEFKLKFEESTGNNGLLFHANEQDLSSYYFYGINNEKNLVFSKFVNNEETIIKKESVKNSTLSLGICFDNENKSISLYLSETYLFTYKDENYLEGQNVLFSAKDIKITLQSYKKFNYNSYLTDLDYYDQAAGSFDQVMDQVISTAEGSLAINNTTAFSSGSLSVTTVLPGKNGDNGIVFGLTAPEGRFWEGQGISYYFFFTSNAGSAYLGKTDNGSWTVCSEKPISNFKNTNSYNLKVNRDGTTIKCYVDNLLYLTFVDDKPLTGTKFGYRAQRTGVTFYNTTLTN